MTNFPNSDPANSSPLGFPVEPVEPGAFREGGVRGLTLLEAAATLSANVPIGEKVLNDYVRDQSRILRAGELSGGESSNKLEGFKITTLTRLVDNIYAIESGNFLAPSLRGVPEPMELGRPGKIEQNLNGSKSKEWIRYLLNSRGMGLHRRDTLALGLTPFYICYAPEMNYEGSMDRMKFPLNPVQAEAILGDASRVGDASAIELAQALRSKGETDTSKTLLDRRVTAFLSLASVELAAVAVDDLRHMGKLGGQYADRAQALLVKYKDVLFASADVPVQILTEAATFLSAAHARVPERDRNTKRVLSALLTRMRDVVDHVDSLGPNFRRIYDGFGYEYPSVLAPSAIVEAEPLVGGQISGEQIGVSVEISEGDVALGGAARHAGAEAIRREAYKQFDAIVLAKEHGKVDPGKFRERMRKVAEGIAAGTPGVDVEMVWARLNDLGEIWDRYGGDLFVSKQGSLGNAPPYFFVVFGEEGSRFIVAETPVPDNATYVISERHVPGTVFEVLLLKRREAREVGAVQVIHSTKHPHGAGHTTKIHDHITRLLATEGI